MATDPRLENTSLLALAAFRVQQRRQHAVPDWRHIVGISQLLEVARSLPTRGPWELPDLEAAGAMGWLLAEARQWEDARHGA
jgi:hypothetical protein